MHSGSKKFFGSFSSPRVHGTTQKNSDRFDHSKGKILQNVLVPRIGSCSLMLFNLSFVSRFDESFFGKFIVMWNLGFVYGSYLATCYFGNLPKPPTEFLTGKIINGNFFYVRSSFSSIFDLLSLS